MSRADYNGPMAVSYDAGRALLPETVEVWRSAISSFVGSVEGSVLDLGSGTGRFSGLIAGWFDVDVVGVEPARGMMAAALSKPRHPHVRFVRGAAEHLPLAHASCRIAWLSNVAHHFDDMALAARELRRVVVPGGAVFIRTAFTDRPAHITLFDEYFPEACEVFKGFPTFAQTVETFEATGWRLERVERFEQLIARSRAEFLERCRTRADSTLEAISDEAFAAGLARIEADVAREARDGVPMPVWDPLDLVLLR